MKQSRTLNEIHSSMKRIHELGIADKQTMKTFDKLCLKDIKEFSPEEIRMLRDKEHVSQSILARYLNISPSTIAQWERGVKKPSGAALKLLNLIEEKGIAILI
ncbi:MAG: helix-turn-helix domain-containing protein [Proteobacteria bacterium]|nr:MAG: helix-turn-helix domain-containing protein [Pseudomonadota bacterium]